MITSMSNDGVVAISYRTRTDVPSSWGSHNATFFINRKPKAPSGVVNISST